MKMQTIQKSIESAKSEGLPVSQLSDGFHSFDELYRARLALTVALFNEWASQGNKYAVQKSWRHSDGGLCFGGGWFIVVAKTPKGLVSFHYAKENWNLFKIEEVPQSTHDFDGHSTEDALTRLLTI